MNNATRRSAGLIILGALLLFIVKMDAQTSPSTYVGGQLVVLPRDGNAIASLHALGYTSLSAITGTGYRVMGIRPGLSEAAALSELLGRGDIISADYNRIARAFLTPNDPSFALQYHLAITRCTEAWDITQGSSSDTIAVVDSGGDTKHLDLVGRVVFAAGSDILDGDSDPSEPTTGGGHATLVSGTVAATTDNATDVSGVDWNSRLLFVRVLGTNGSGSFSNIANGILNAVSHKATVINLSLGDTNVVPATIDVVEYALLAARNAGIIVSIATGNSASSGFETVAYPGNSLHAIGVGASTSADLRATFSEFKKPDSLKGVDVVAPGQTILTLSPGFGTTTVDGTSFSAPIVSGLATLLKSIRREYTPANFLTLIRATAKDINTAGFDAETGHGRVDALNMLRTAQNNTVFPFANDSNAYRVDLFNGTLGDVRTATASTTTGRQGRSGVAISGDNIFVGYDSSVNKDTGSVEFYVRFDSAQPSETRYILTQHGSAAKPKGSLDLILTSDSKLQFSLQDSGVITSQTTLRPGQWYHVGLTYGPKGMILHVNGESEASRLVTGGPTPADTIYVGAPTAFGGARSARCQVDALRFSKTQRIIFASALATKIWSLSSRAINAVNVSWTALKNDTTGVLVNIYADMDSSGYDGVLLASNVANDGQESVALDLLATNGDPFYIYVEAYDSSFPSERALAYSDTAFQGFSPLAALLSSSAPATDQFCLVSSWHIPRVLPWLRLAREYILDKEIGRLFTRLYYLLG